MTEYMDPDRPKPIKGPTGVDLTSETHNPPAPEPDWGSQEGNYSDRSPRSVPINRGK